MQNLCAAEHENPVKTSEGSASGWARSKILSEPEPYHDAGAIRKFATRHVTILSLP
jgi:hypothetical protein